jgi:hypothetical protein
MTVRTLIAATVIAAGFGMGVSAQKLYAPRAVPPTVMAGPDVGFRVEAIDGDNAPLGHIVVRVNGKWVEARIGGVFNTARPVQ